MELTPHLFAGTQVFKFSLAATPPSKLESTTDNVIPKKLLSPRNKRSFSGNQRRLQNSINYESKDLKIRP
jgi:hypothetical protein